MNELLIIIFLFTIIIGATYIRRLLNKIRLKDEIIESMTIEQNIENINQNISVLVDDVRTIKRGVYGDPSNKVVGIIERQLMDDLRISVLEDSIIKDKNSTKKLGIMAGVAIIILEGWHQFKDVFK
jgi:hypothetical protein